MLRIDVVDQILGQMVGIAAHTARQHGTNGTDDLGRQLIICIIIIIIAADTAIDVGLGDVVGKRGLSEAKSGTVGTSE